MVSVPGDGGYEVEAGESCHEAMKTMSLASLRAIRPVPGDSGWFHKCIPLFTLKKLVKLSSLQQDVLKQIMSLNKLKLIEALNDQAIHQCTSSNSRLHIIPRLMNNESSISHLVITAWKPQAHDDPRSAAYWPLFSASLVVRACIDSQVGYYLFISHI